MSAIEEKQEIDYKKLGVGRFVNIFFKMNSQQNKLAVQAIKRLIVFTIATRPFFGKNSIGFFWIDRFNQDVNSILNEITRDYYCQITFSEDESSLNNPCS